MSSNYSAAQIAGWLQTQIAERLKRSPELVALTAPFADLGLSSREAVGLSGDLQAWLGRKVAPTVLWEYSTIQALSDFLAHDQAQQLPLPKPKPSQASATSSSAIAIVAMSCRLPGADSPEALWQLLLEGRSAIGFVPADRWDAQALYSPEARTPGKINTRWGGFLDQVDQFDPQVFGISGREASRIDPQQRLALEVAWETFERAGIAPDQLVGSATGVFLGISSNDYARLQFAQLDQLDAYAGTGNAHSIAANRLSYVFGLQGPSMALDTACSSSLVAVHLASQSLLAGECEQALAGGVNLILNPELSVTFAQAQMLSGTGECHTFDAAADGYVRSEGCGMVLLKRLDVAEAAGDPILAVIHGSAVNQDGRSNGLTAPNGQAQQAVIRQALAKAQIQPDQLSYIEAHGTGTPLGDPIEVAALQAVLGERQQPCLLGSLKSNLGHLEAAAGIAGLIKLVLAFQQQIIPAQANFKQRNPQIELGSALEIATTPQPWYSFGSYAGISSFGFGGTNAHVILGAAPIQPKRLPQPSPAPIQLLALQANSETALRQLTERYQAYLAQTEVNLADICWSAYHQRATMRHRLIVSATDKIQMLERLQHAWQAQATGSIYAEQPQPAPRIAFVCSGQGSQYVGMAQTLYQTQPLVRQILDQANSILNEYLAIPLLDVLYQPDHGALLRDTRYTQPAIFVVSYALGQLWRSWGIEPVALLGHSIGEYSAAVLAGVWSFEQGLRLVAQRAQLMHGLPEHGAMLAIRSPLESIEPLLAQHQLDLAAINGPNAVVVAGSVAAISQCAVELNQLNITNKLLDVSHGFHSRLMQPMLADFQQVLSAYPAMAPQIRLIANLDGSWHEQAPSAEYWVEHTRQPVQFYRGLQSLVASGVSHMLELGGHSTLIDLGRQAGLPNLTWLASLRRQQADWETLYHAAATLLAHGCQLNWAAMNPDYQPQAVLLPTYAFDRQRYWFTEGTGMNQASAQPTPASASSRHSTILAELRSLTANLLHVKPEQINIHSSFVEMGADSLVMIDAGRAIESRYNVHITMRQLFEDLASLDALARFLDAHGTFEAEPAPSEPSVVPIVAQAQPVAPAAVTPVAAAGLEAVVQQQLALMQQQLALLAGQPAAVTPIQPVTPASATPATPVIKPASTPAAAAPKAYVPYQPVRPGSITANDLSSQQQAHLQQLIKDYTTRTATSKQLTQAYRAQLADNRESAGFRFSIKEMLYTLICERSEGSKIWDVDNNQYLDLTMGFGVNLFGHRPEITTQALANQLAQGYQLGPQTRLAGEVAQLICRITGMERVAFCNSGTEAVLTAIRAARTVTGRKKIALFAGSYHGFYDATLATAQAGAATRSVPLAPGIPQGMVDDIVVLDYVTPESLVTLEQLLPELAAVLVEPVQSRRPDLQPQAFLQAVRELTKTHGSLLIFDEMITGFRIAAGGAQAWFGIEADLATYGKIVGGGMPIGVVAGRGATLDALDGGFWQYGDDSFPQAETTFVAGTFCKHPLALASAKAVLTAIEHAGQGLYDQLNQQTASFAAEMNAYFAQAEAPISVVHFGSLFRFSFKQNLDLFFYHLLLQGIYIWEGRNCFFSTAHSTADVEWLKRAIRNAVEALQDGGFLPKPQRQLNQPHSFALSEDQYHLWVLGQLGQHEAIAYNLPTGLEIRGQLDLVRLEQAFNLVVQRHESLRTIIASDGTQQIVQPQQPITINFSDFSSAANQQQALDQWFTQHNQQVFDLSQTNPLRCNVAQLGPDRYALSLVVHHLLVDGWSVGVILQEVAQMYQVLSDGQTPQLAQPLQFRDYLAWKAGRDLTTQANFWQALFAELPAPLALPTDYPRPALKSYVGQRVMQVLEPASYQALKQLSRQSGATLFMVLLAGYQLLLHRLTGQNDLVVGIPAAARSFEGSETIVGYCGNLLPLRSRLQAEQSFSDYLHLTRQQLFDAYENEDYSLAQLLAVLNPMRDASRSAIVETLFNFEPPTPAPNFGGLETSFVPQSISATALDLSVNVIELNQQLVVYCDYNSDLFEQATIERWLGHYQTLLLSAAQQPTSPAERLALLNPSETNVLLETWNATAKQVPFEQTYSQLFTDQVQRTPSAIAISDQHTNYSYQALDQRANRLANYLQSLAISTNQVVAILADRSCDFVSAVLGVFKAGAAYLPLDLEHPPRRLAQVLQQSQSRLVLVGEAWQATLAAALSILPSDQRPIIVLLEQAFNPELSSEAPTIQSQASDLAYVIYTSGSTGLPKGAMIEQRGMVNHLYAKIIDLQLTAADRVAQNARQSFDISVWQMLVALLVGAETQIYPDSIARDPEVLLSYAEQQATTILEIVPSLLGAWLTIFPNRANDLPSFAQLRWLLLTGEALPPAACRDWFTWYPTIPLMNAYGPTECSDDVTHYVVREAPAAHVVHMPIGRPVINTRLYILDGLLQPVPIGVIGELYVGGVGVGRGYLNDPERTQAVFAADPFMAGGRWYRTGDLARYRSDGTIEYLGRIDHQVKVRGFRIELGEIEAALAQHQAVHQSIVTATPNAQGQLRLIAYVVSKAADQPAEQATSARLEQWDSVWADTYDQLSAGDHGTINTIGWNDSYTRQPFSAEAMHEWSWVTVRNILAQQPSRILELGCGTGMLLLPLAPYCLSYRGHDIAAEVLAYVQQRLDQQIHDWPHVSLAQFPAHDFSNIAPHSVDTIVINSVAQYFPSIDYLVQVLAAGLEALVAGGRIYLGDIRNLSLNPLLHASIQLFQAPNELAVEQIAQLAQQQHLRDQELVIDPSFFYALQQQYPQISHIELVLKRGRIHNELTRFRYDVVLHVQRPSLDLQPHWFDWQADGLSLSLVRQVLEQSQPDALGIANVPNSRLSEACGLWQALHVAEQPSTAGELKQALQPLALQGIDPEDWYNLHLNGRYRISVSLAQSGELGCYDVLFYATAKLADGGLPQQIQRLASPRKAWSAYANNPLQESQSLTQQFRQHLRQALPDYMQPEAFVLLEQLPLTPNGKVDRRALAALEAPIQTTTYLAPRNPLEQQLASLFEQVLNLNQVGVDQSFFELGGHSLTGTQLIGLIRSECHADLPLRTLFEAPTVGELALRVAAAQTEPSEIAKPTALKRQRQRVNLNTAGFGQIAESNDGGAA
ncbi:MAG TPA: non-ribosomal peptide synthetase [Herpetosiphon sp.]|uniref:non-ribosomal peptide synthetase/type I polyketide synthase n=1 Tax=Herpetosiphon sp. TaxID=71864 RepID=UPI0000DDB939|nr:non-ribosomal peptide synthetase/type I polyketide synthase [Herpetosiphon sp.]HBW52247.1 non-ribosomal peptide synthetase [Herpetosiphon sp.]